MNLLKIINEVAQKESTSFIVEKKGSTYDVHLPDSFKNSFKEEVDTTIKFFIDEVTKKLNKNLNVVLRENDKVKIYPKMINEAEYQGKDVELNEPERGDVKKFKVYVKDPKTGKIKKVNFGDKNMEIKRDDPDRRKAFRARHNCDDPGSKTKARYWSCKMWSDKSVSDILNEVIEPNSIDVDYLQKHENLNLDIFDHDKKMHSDVRKALIKIAIEFIKFAKIENLKYKDIILTGSLANYNWTEQSDLDVHILTDFNQIHSDQEFVGEYFRTKKNLWTEKFPIKVKGHDVEVYVQDINEPHSSTGIYSLIKNEWLTKPIDKMIALDVANIQLKAADFMNAIDEISDSENKDEIVKEIDRIQEKLRNYRKGGLEKEGEYSTENLVFKILRHTGYLEKLVEIKKSLLTDILTLENVSMYSPNLADPDLIDN